MESYNNTIKKLSSIYNSKPQPSNTFPDEAYNNWVHSWEGQILLISFIYHKSPEEIIEDLEGEEIKKIQMEMGK